MSRNYLKNLNENSFFDSFFDSFFEPNEGHSTYSLMRTDIHEHGDHYVLKVDLPAVKKEDVKVSIEDGYLVINAEVKREEEEGGKLLRKERYYGSFIRKYYVGNDITEKEVSASLDNGVLKVIIKKPEHVEPEKKYIEIK